MNARSNCLLRLLDEFKSAGTAVVLLSVARELLSATDELLAASLSDGSVTPGDTVSAVAGPYLIVESTGASVELKGFVSVDSGETGAVVVLEEDGGVVPEDNNVVPVEDGGAVAGIVEVCASA